MIINLSSYWQEKLMDLPETGSGYQLVSVWLKDGRYFPRIMVLNCTEMVLKDDLDEMFDEEDIEDITLAEIM